MHTVVSDARTATTGKDETSVASVLMWKGCGD